MDSWDRMDLVVALDEPNEPHRESLRTLCDALSADAWVPEPPQFIDEVEDDKVGDSDIPVRTVGLVLSVLAPVSGGQRLSPSEDQRQFRQAERFFDIMSDYSLRNGARCRVYYGGEEIGEIAGRELSRGIADGLGSPDNQSSAVTKAAR